MSFIDQRLLECVAYGSEGGPTANTRRVILKSGITRRNASRSRPLHRYVVLYNNRSAAEKAEIIRAFNVAAFGGGKSFRWRDLEDCTAVDEVLQVVGTGTSQSVQLTKAYTWGGQTIYRLIRKPVLGTVTMTHNGAALTASIDYSTGIATFTTTAGHVIRWTGEFDVPVMFEDDALMFAAVNRNEDGLILTSDVALIEDLAE